LFDELDLSKPGKKYKPYEIERAKSYFNEYFTIKAAVKKRLEESESWIQIETVLMKIWHLAILAEKSGSVISIVDVPLYVMTKS
jgi:hypothetical protein